MFAKYLSVVACFGFCVQPAISYAGNSPVPQQSAGGAEIRVVPEETDEILANPGMGWQTFHHTALDDKNLPSWIHSTVQYIRWGWKDLEPQQGELARDFLDGVLKETRAAGQSLAFRVMCCSPSPRRPYHPAWLADIGGHLVRTKKDDAEVPDLDDPVILNAHLDFIRKLGALYDGHPDIDHIDLGSVGWWGEWHMSGAGNISMPTQENQQKIVDAYLAAFQKTPLVMLIGGQGSLVLPYAIERGTGWRADCYGDMKHHMVNYYPNKLARDHAMNVWKKAPVAWETCWDMRHWVEEGWSLRTIFNYGLALHASVINNKSAPLPEGEQPRAELERFLRRLGYRFVLKELRHSKHVIPGGKLELMMQWQNTGSAPCYRPYRLAYRLSNGNQQRLIISDVTVNRWMPGDMVFAMPDFLSRPVDLPPGDPVDVRDAIIVPDDIAPGEYTLSIAVVGAKTGAGTSMEPVVRLGIKGREADGWYSVSGLVVK